jgi:tripartite ATP-independent transporter DctM subunit
MDLVGIGIAGVIAMLALLFMGVPVGFALSFVGIVGYFIIAGFNATLSQFSLITFSKGTDFVLVCVPLFVMMGQLVFYTKIASDLYRCFQAWVGRLPGGLAIASVLSCGAFAAVTGSSAASVATMGSIIMPEMKKYGYNTKLATGVLAASGTLAILIPPSLGFIFYGILTDTSIGDLFIAGILPGMITVFSYCGGTAIRAILHPSWAPVGPKFTWAERFDSIKGIWPIFLIFIVVIGGLYAGMFTPTEASAIGVFCVMVLGYTLKRITWKGFQSAVHDTGVISAMIFVILIGGYMISRFLALTHITELLVNFVGTLNLSKNEFIYVMIFIYLILGMMLDVFGMLVLSIPFLFPITLKMGIDPIWFGVFVVMMTEIAMLTPPIGTNVYILKSIVPDIPMSDIFRGIVWFTCCDLVLVVLLIYFPQLALWLPQIAGQ